MQPDFYYLESDGQIFLVRDGARFRFPRSKKELPCPFQPGGIIPVGEKNVLFAHPVLKHHPEHWFHKDEVIGRSDVDGLVQQAVNRTLPRAAAKVAIIEGGKVLMVMGGRGITKDMWNLPGGFVGYGEHPEESARREVREELGIGIRWVRTLGVYAQTFPRTGGYMISFIYLARRTSKRLRPHPEEIKDVRWFPLAEARRVTRNPFVKAGLSDFLRRRRSA